MTEQNLSPGSRVRRNMDPGQDFASFVAGHGRRLLHLAQLLTGDPHTAEDLTQDVLARAFLRWDRVEGDDPYAYVRRALVNARTDRWRRRLPVPVEQPEPHGVVGDHAGAVARRDAVWRALRTLTLRERRVIALRFYEDLTEADTARLMGVAVGTVKSTTSRALGKLRDHPALELQLLEDHR